MFRKGKEELEMCPTFLSFSIKKMSGSVEPPRWDSGWTWMIFVMKRAEEEPNTEK